MRANPRPPSAADYDRRSRRSGETTEPESCQGHVRQRGQVREVLPLGKTDPGQYQRGEPGGKQQNPSPPQVGDER